MTRVALLKGNRFNPWHLEAFAQLPEGYKVTAFRAHSEIQGYFEERGAGALPFECERIWFDAQRGPLRGVRLLQERYGNRPPRVLPFADRLEGFDVVQSWELFTGWTRESLEARCRFGMPLALMVWDTIPFNNEDSPECRATKQRALAEADRLLVHTERSRRMLEIEGADPARIALIPPGVDTERFQPSPVDRKTLGLPADRTVVLFVGWFLPRKGLEWLLYALKELRGQTDPPLHLAMVGSGPGRGRIEGIVARLGFEGACTFLGAVPYRQMPPVYQASDLFVLPSVAVPGWQEQFGMALLEAMASGLPVVTTHSGAIPEIAGDAALLCPPNDFTSLADAIARLLRDPILRTDLASKARSRACGHFALDKQTAALAGVYGELLGK